MKNLLSSSAMANSTGWQGRRQFRCAEAHIQQGKNGFTMVVIRSAFECTGGNNHRSSGWEAEIFPTT